VLVTVNWGSWTIFSSEVPADAATCPKDETAPASGRRATRPKCINRYRVFRVFIGKNESETTTQVKTAPANDSTDKS
jgi:hypothetical protein